MVEFKLTKQLKEDWLKALKSGDFEQFAGTLRNPNNFKQCCCLGVLASIHPDIEIDDSYEEGACVIEGKILKYFPFNEMGIHDVNNSDLVRENDTSYYEGIRDYSTVIPLIEQLKAVN